MYFVICCVNFWMCITLKFVHRVLYSFIDRSCYAHFYLVFPIYFNRFYMYMQIQECFFKWRKCFSPSLNLYFFTWISSVYNLHNIFPLTFTINSCVIANDSHHLLLWEKLPYNDLLKLPLPPSPTLPVCFPWDVIASVPVWQVGSTDFFRQVLISQLDSDVDWLVWQYNVDFNFGSSLSY